MYPFIETIRIEQGKACNLSYHNERLNNTLYHFWPDCAGIELGEYLKLTPEMNGMKCRVIYDGGGIKEISYEAYQMRPVHSLQLVYSDDIDYTYKSTDHHDSLSQSPQVPFYRLLRLHSWQDLLL